MSRGRISRAEKATLADCDWSYLERDAWRGCIYRAAKRAAWITGCEEGDVLSELALWYAVRPEITTNGVSQDIVNLKAMEQAAKLLRKHIETVSLEAAGIE